MVWKLSFASDDACMTLSPQLPDIPGVLNKYSESQQMILN